MQEENSASVYYPQAACLLRLRLEDFSSKKTELSQQNFEITCLTKRVTVNINDYNSADTFSLDLDYDSFPFDPRSIRAVGVLIAIEDMNALYNSDGSPKKIEINSSNIVFQGFADEEKISFDDTNRTVSLEGRDFTSLLIDRKYLEGNVSLDKRIDVVIERLLKKLEETRDLAIEFRGLDKAKLPILSSFYSDKSELSGRRNVRKDQTYWELIQSIVADAGLIAFIEIDKLVITKPQVLFDKTKAKRFVYGKNLKTLEFSRKIGRKKGFNIIVRSLNVETKQVVEARIPKEATNEWTKETGIPNIEVVRLKPKPINEKKTTAQTPQTEADKNEPAEYIAFRVSNVSSKKQLVEIAQSIYLEMSRQQLEGSFSTKEMAIKFIDDASRVTLFNVLKLRTGTPLDIDISIPDKRAIDAIKKDAIPTSSQKKKSIENYLLQNNYDRRVARSLSESLATSESSSFFYTKSIEFSLDYTSGFEAKVDFINFIEIDKK